MGFTYMHGVITLVLTGWSQAFENWGRERQGCEADSEALHEARPQNEDNTALNFFSSASKFRMIRLVDVRQYCDKLNL